MGRDFSLVLLFPLVTFMFDTLNLLFEMLCLDINLPKLFNPFPTYSAFESFLNRTTRRLVMTERIKEKLASLRSEADNAIARAEEAEAKIKKLEQVLLEKDQEITSYTHRLSVIDADLEKAEAKLAEYKASNAEGESTRQTNDNLTRKVQLLEDELDAAEKNVKETVEKLRQVDVKAEHFEKQVQRIEHERDQWEQKYETEVAAHKKTKDELDKLADDIGTL